MNVYGIIILVTLLLEYGLNLVADILNLRALRPELPTAFRGVYDAEAYRQSQAYTRVRTQFSWFSSTCTLVVTLLFWFTGGFNALDQIVRGWGWGPVWTGLAYIGLLLLGRLLRTRAAAVLDYVHSEWEDDHRQGETSWSFAPEVCLLLGAQLVPTQPEALEVGDDLPQLGEEARAVEVPGRLARDHQQARGHGIGCGGPLGNGYISHANATAPIPMAFSERNWRRDRGSIVRLNIKYRLIYESGPI